MLEVYQQLEVTVQLTQDRMAACIVGADYDLYRYGYEDLPAVSPADLLTSGSQKIDLSYSYDPTFEYIVDPKSLKLYADGLLAVGAEGSEGECYIDEEDPFILRAPQGKLFAWATDTIPEGYTPALGTDSPEVETGDTIAVWTGTVEKEDGAIPLDKIDLGDDSQRYTSVVADVVGAVTPAAVGDLTLTGSETVEASVAISNNADGSAGSINEAALTEDTVFQIAATSLNDGVLTCQITDSAGLTTAVTKKLTAGSAPVTIALGNTNVEVTVTVPATFTDADAKLVITVPLTAKGISSTHFDGVRLVNTVVPLGVVDTYEGATGTKLTLVRQYKAFTGWLDGVTPTLDAEVDPTAATWEGYPVLRTRTGHTLPFVTDAGHVYQQFRVMLSPAETEDVFRITSREDIQTYFGTISTDNDLAYGCAAALEGSAGRPIYALRVRYNTAEAYVNALNKVETNTSTYSFAILTEDYDIRHAVADFVERRSRPDTKRWCRALCGIDNPGTYRVASLGTDGAPIKAAIKKSKNGLSWLLTLHSDNFDFTDIRLFGTQVSLREGDFVELASGEKFRIERVGSATSLTLGDGPEDTVTDGRIWLWKADSPANAGEYVAAAAEDMGNRRFTVVYCDRGTATELDNTDTLRTVEVSNKYLAAAVAGIASAVVPQAPITRTEVPTVEIAPRMHTLYTQDMLDNIAKHGVLIVTQDTKNSPCYIRHQLTTETDKGSLYYEESCTRNLDNISYDIVDTLEHYIGRSNVTPSALRSIMNDVTATLNARLQDSPNDLIGPSLVNWDSLTVEQDPVFKDRVIVRVKLYLPLPLNNIKVYEMAYAATVTI